MEQEKDIRWSGSSYEDLLAFPEDPRRQAGFQLGKVQAGLDPDDWKPFDDVGKGVREIRIRDRSGAYRIMYVAKFDDVIYVCCTAFRRKLRRQVSRTKKLRRRVIAPS